MSNGTEAGAGIPEKGWENPFAPGTWLHDLFEDVVSEKRDLLMVVDDILGRRGTGKTIATLQLINRMDQTPLGITKEKATLQPEVLRNAYTSQPLRSGLCFDEAEWGASNRKAMSNTNQAIREIVSMGRVEQKYVVINAPIKGFIDRDLLKLADVWISMVRKGLGLVHQLKWEAYSEQLLTPKKQWLEFDDVERGTELREVYNYLTAEKKERIDGSGGQEYFTADELSEAEEQAREQARQDLRNEIIERLDSHPEIQEHITQQHIGEVVGLTRQRVNQILNDR